MPKKARQSGISAEVLKYLSKHKKKEVHIQDIADDLGFTRLQVAGAMTTLRNNDAEIESPMKGWYVYHGSPQNGKAQTHTGVGDSGEVVAVLQEGLLVNFGGILFIATELEVG